MMTGGRKVRPESLSYRIYRDLMRFNRQRYEIISKAAGPMRFISHSGGTLAAGPDQDDERACGSVSGEGPVPDAGPACK